jgi:D-glycero-D-manno-heptose 1,7-bisphosphate phosphatase
MDPKDLLRNVVFLDRDGVVNRDSLLYVTSWSEFEFLPRSLEAIRDLTHAGFTVFVITNQSALARRMITLPELENLHRRMQQAVAAAGGRITEIFFCPHHPDDDCSCRKPKPGLISRAAGKYPMDLSAAVMVGDSTKDIECARNAGCGRAVLVRTGNGRQAETELAARQIAPDFVAEDLYDAARWIIGTKDGGKLGGWEGEKDN